MLRIGQQAKIIHKDYFLSNGFSPHLINDIGKIGRITRFLPKGISYPDWELELLDIDLWFIKFEVTNSGWGGWAVEEEHLQLINNQLMLFEL